MSCRHCSTCFGHHYARQTPVAASGFRMNVEVEVFSAVPETCWAVSVRQSNKILRLIVASSWVFYLSDWRCTEPQKLYNFPLLIPTWYPVFYINYIKINFLYMFRASSAHLQEVNDVKCICMQPLVFSFSAGGRLVHLLMGVSP